MAKKSAGKEKVDINYFQAVNSGKKNHYFATVNGVAFGEVSGDTLPILDINVCGVDKDSGTLLSNHLLTLKGLNKDEVRERYERFKNNISSLSQSNLEAKEKKQELERIEKEYFNNCQKVSVNFGYQKLMCIRQWLIDCQGEGKNIFINRFEKDNLDRIRTYVLQPLK